MGVLKKITKGTYKREAVSSRKCDDGNKRLDWSKAHVLAEGCRQTLEAEKGKRQILP
jgi:hypothetical protein